MSPFAASQVSPLDVYKRATCQRENLYCIVLLNTRARLGDKAKLPSKNVKLRVTGFIFVLLITAGYLHYVGAIATMDKPLALTGTIYYGKKVSVSISPEKCVGISNLSLGYMLDWEWKKLIESPSLRQLSENAAFKLVRVFEGRYQTGGSPDPCLSWDDATSTGTFDWTDVDSLVASIFSVGAEPLICLGYWDMSTKYLPNGMSTNPSTALPHPNSWGAYCAEWVRHFNAVALPVRFYEIVNEPYHYYGWDRSETTLMSNYAAIYNAAITAMKNLNPNIMVSFDASTQKKALDYFLANGLNIDYFDIHKYDGTTLTVTDEELLSLAESNRFSESSNWYGIDQARQMWLSANGKSLPVIFTEYNLNYVYETGTDPRIPQMLGAVWTALVLRNSALNNVSSMLYYLLANSASQTLKKGGYGFGMINLDDIKPWYPYYVQKMIGNSLFVGDSMIDSTSDSDDLRVLAWQHQGKLAILLICKTHEPLEVNINGVSGSFNVQWIDETVPFTNATVQTAIVDLRGLRNMNGYTVALLQET